MKPDAASGRRTAEDTLIVALDVPSRARAIELAQSLQGICRWVKVGLELYLAAGEAVVRDLTKAGFSVFLDLKFHDIPNTIAGAVRSAGSLGASLLTVHASGGAEMLAAAAAAAAALPNPPRLLAVTVLTSMDAEQLHATGVEAAPQNQVKRLAALAMASGISGLVCSPQEAATLRGQFGGQAFLVTPGIRPAGAVAGDQKRAATPGAAISAGADMLVVGRPITAAPSPAAAADAILEEIRRARKTR